MAERGVRWRGQPMAETVRSIAAEYGRGDRIRLEGCPSPGTVAEVRCEGGVIQYRAEWDDFPSDTSWYDEDDVRLVGSGDDD